MRNPCAKAAALLGGCLALALGGSSAAVAEDAVSPPASRASTGLVVDPRPIPRPAEGRVPIGLRLTNTIWSNDDLHPPAAKQVRFHLDRGFRFGMARVPTCEPRGGRSIRTGEGSCEVGQIAEGPIKFQVAFPGEQSLGVVGRVAAYKTGPRTALLHSWLEAPVAAEVLIPVTIDRKGTGNYGLRITASIPKVAGGNGSLVYLGLSFRRGLFSLACPKGRIKSSLTNTFADGSTASATLGSAC